jgi:hypothetical protein
MSTNKSCQTGNAGGSLFCLRHQLAAKSGGFVMKFRKKPVVVEAYQTDEEICIDTLEGRMHANAGDWIITGVRGERYPCAKEIFEETYEPVPDNMQE